MHKKEFMMTRMQKVGVIALCFALAAGSVLPGLLRGQSTAPSAARGGATGVDAATQKLLEQLQSTQDEAQKYMPSLMSLADPQFRAGDGQKAIPALRKMATLLGELQNTVPAKLQDDIRTSKYRYMAFAGALGDKETLATLETQAQGKDAQAVSAKSALAFAHWLESSKDAAAQLKILDDYAPVAKANPSSDEVLGTLEVMANVGPAGNDSTKKIIGVIRTNMNADFAKETLDTLDNMQEQIALVGKPLTVQGRTSTGGKFDSADYKGKVVLLDFWATWCGPCIAELPNVKKAYSDYHDKGFEIVGISCDADDSVLNTFTKDKEMPWMQLRENSQKGEDRWHPLAKKFHVDGIPAMFLIDRKGVLRHVDAREDLEKKVAALVAEAPAAAPAPK
jgi:thiol-disulfide isomerase/thioredoxin